MLKGLSFVIPPPGKPGYDGTKPPLGRANSEIPIATTSVIYLQWLGEDGFFPPLPFSLTFSDSFPVLREAGHKVVLRCRSLSDH